MSRLATLAALAAALWLLRRFLRQHSTPERPTPVDDIDWDDAWRDVYVRAAA
jgi:hypothetical protein